MTFENENDLLLEDILNDSFYKGFKDPKKKRYPQSSLELNITASCNQKCEYCYLTKFGEDIYPTEIRKHSDIVNNTRMLIEYYMENNMNPGTLDIFSGEIWGTKLGNDVFDILLEYIRKGWGVTYIMIPSNMSFILNKTKLKTVRKYIRQFKDAGCRLTFSASVDGLLLESEQRSFINEDDNKVKEDMKFYDDLFSFCKEYGFAYHPMVAASGIGKWIENYKWWQFMFSKYELNPFEYGMYLEVRNDEWTIDAIDKYLDFVNFMIDYDFKEILGSEMSTFVKEAIVDGCDPKKGYFPYVILNEGNTFNCTINTSLIVRMGDLAIGPCHRTHYEKFTYGKYRVQDGKITGVKANNVQLANLVLNQTSKSMMVCNKCPISTQCMRGCLGSQYESTGEILQPCDSVCQLLKARVIFLYIKYKHMGVYDYVAKSGIMGRKLFLDNFEKDVLLLKEGEPQLWKFWEMKSKKKIS